MLVGRERVEVGSLTVRKHEEVTDRVRMQIHQSEHVATTPDDERLLVGPVRIEDLPEDAPVRIGTSLEIAAAPSGPESLVHVRRPRR
jgi:hypothetical protein